MEAGTRFIIGDRPDAAGRCRITPVNLSQVIVGDARTVLRAIDKQPRSEGASVVPAGGFSLASAFGIGVSQVSNPVIVVL